MGVAPGTARITAKWGSLSDYTEVTVRNWDVPAMKADFSGIAFLSADKLPESKDRKFENEFDSRSGMPIWTQFSLDIEQAVSDRALSAPFSYTLYYPDNSIAEKYDFTITVQKEWPSVWRAMRLDFSKRTPGVYRIELWHEGKVLGTAQFSIR
jgi:hypothetical protein